MLTDIGADDFLHHTSQVVILSLQILSNSIMISLIWGAKYIWSAIAASTLTGSSLSVRKMLMVCLTLPVEQAQSCTWHQSRKAPSKLCWYSWTGERLDLTDLIASSKVLTHSTFCSKLSNGRQIASHLGIFFISRAEFLVIIDNPMCLTWVMKVLKKWMKFVSILVLEKVEDAKYKMKIKQANSDHITWCPVQGRGSQAGRELNMHR